MFSFEDDACASAKEYLAQLESFYSGKESGAEVMEGIEERMGELLIEKSGQGGVVSQRMVSDVIAVLGRPEAIEEDPDAPGDPSGAGHSSPESGPVEASGRSSRNTAGTLPTGSWPVYAAAWERSSISTRPCSASFSLSLH